MLDIGVDHVYWMEYFQNPRYGGGAGVYEYLMDGDGESRYRKGDGDMRSNNVLYNDIIYQIIIEYA